MATPSTAWKSNTAFNKFNGSYFNNSVDVSGGDVICRTGNFYMPADSSIYSPNNRIFFNEQYLYTNFSQNVHVFGTFQLDRTGTTYDVAYEIASNLPSQISTNATNIATNATNTTSNTSNISSLQTAVSILNAKTTNMTYASSTNTTTFSGVLSFPTTSIDSGSIQNNNFLALSGVQACSGNKTFAGNIIVSASGNGNFNGLLQALGSYLRVDGELRLGTNTITISQATLQKLQYLSTVSSDIQTQVNNCAKTNTVNTFSLAQTFSVAPTMSGANIAAGTIPSSALASASAYVDLTTNQTISSGIKTFTVAPILSGASISASSIPNSALATQYLDLTTSQTISGNKTLTGNLIVSSQTITPLQISYLNRVIANPTTGFYEIYPTGLTYPTYGSATQNLGIASSSVDTIVLMASTGSTDITNSRTGFEFVAITGNTSPMNLLNLLKTGASFNVGVNITGGLNFSGSINAIPNTTFGYINGLTSSAQGQINTTNTNVTNLTTQVNKIGTLVTVSITSTAITYVSTVFKNIGSISLTAGTWLVNTQVHMLGGGTFSITVPSVFGFSTSATTLPNASDDPQMTGTTNSSIGITYFYQFYLKPTATTTYYLNTQPNFAGGGLNNGARTVIRAVQIA